MAASSEYLSRAHILVDAHEKAQAACTQYLINRKARKTSAIVRHERPPAVKDENTIVARRLPDGSLVEVLADGSTRPFPTDSTDWAALDAMTEEGAEAGARRDPENPPLTPEREARLKRVPAVKIMRQAMGLSQEAFSVRFHVPLAALREWEQGVSEPDETTRAYLTVIARDPEAVRRALQLGPAPAGKQFG